MNAIELFHKDGRSAGVFYCEKCRIVKRTKGEADVCCTPMNCTDCGVAVETKSIVRPFSVQCDACCSAEQKRKERERFEKAEKLTEWDGPVYREGFGRDGYAENIADMLDYIEDADHEDRPEYVWACTVEPFVKADVSDITERICDDAYPDFDPDDLSGLEELKAAIQAFNERNRDAVVWNPDYSKAVLIPKEAA